MASVKQNLAHSRPGRINAKVLNDWTGQKQTPRWRLIDPSSITDEVLLVAVNPGMTP